MRHEDLAEAVNAVAAEVGQYILSRWRGEIQQWEKVPGHPVSDVDMEADRMLRDRLRALDPEAGWLSEETADNAERLMRSRVWVVDPIDGTRDFIRGREGWAVSIALVAGGRPLLGVLEAPARAERWTAIAGRGAYRNGDRVRVSGRDSLMGARVPADAVPKIDTDLVPVHKPNSIALRIAMVASGEADLLATLRWGYEWDIAAAGLIAQEGGATVTDVLGNPLRYNSTRGEAFGVLAATPAIHGPAMTRLAERARKASIR